MNHGNSTWLNKEILSGLVMVLGGLCAITMVNTGLNPMYQEITDFTLKIGFGTRYYEFPLRYFIHEILMVIFFTLVAMELKIEMKEGILSKPKDVILPGVAAIGGMVAPAIVFYLFNFSVKKNLSGVAIPCATDIAFAIAMFNMVGRRLPAAVKVFLLSVAIFDDLGAIIIIAVFYNNSFALLSLIVAFAIIAFMYLLCSSRIGRFWIYFVSTCALWAAFHSAGIHTTMAGVILGLALPLQSRKGDFSPLKTVMKAIAPWVYWVILPLFAFSACEIKFSDMSPSDLLTPLSFGITSGLFIGKQLGIFGFAYLLVKNDISSLPKGTSWWHIYFVSCLAGIGFTMSLFIGELAFPGEGYMQNLVKSGIIAGSFLSAIWGYLVVKIFGKS